MATDTAARDALAAQLRAQYGGSGSGSGNWDDAGYDRAGELADLLLNAGVTNLGDLRFVDTPYQSEGGIPLQDKYPGAQQVSVLRGGGDSEYYDSVWVDANGVPIEGVLYDGDSMPYVSGMVDTTGRQLMIGDKAVGYLGDYNNDGTFGNKADTILRGVGDEALLGWSARGRGNTSYRVVTDPTTGKLVITPGWNSSSDAADFRKAGIFLAGAALGGAGISGSLAGAAGLAGTSGGAALSGAATGAGLNMATTQKLDENTLKAGAIGGLGGYLGHATGINQLASDFAKEYLPSLPSYTGGGADVLVNGGTDAMVGGGTDAVLDAAGNPVRLTPAAMESGLGTPGYGFNASAATSGLYDPAVIGSGAGLMYGPGGAIVPYDPAAVSAMTANDAVTKPKLDLKNTDNWTEEQWNEFLKESGDVPYDTPIQGKTVEVTASRLPTPVTASRLPTPINPGGAIGAGIGATLPNYGNEGNNYPPSTNNPDYGNEGKNYPTPESTQGPGGSPVNAGPTPDWGSSIKDWILNNPELAATLAGSFLGNVGGDNTNPPPVPGTGPQANLTSTPAASLGRRYVAPPPGYRPGIDPEHRYFTGIGAVGTGG